MPSEGLQIAVPPGPSPSAAATPAATNTRRPSPSPTRTGAIGHPATTTSGARTGASPTPTPTPAPTPTPVPIPTATPPPAAAKPRAQILAPPQTGTVTADIYAAAARYRVSYSWLVGVAACESGLNPNAYNGSSGATGLFQFMPSTFYSHGGTDIWSPIQQANIAAAMFAAGESGQWACA